MLFFFRDIAWEMKKLQTSRSYNVLEIYLPKIVCEGLYINGIPSLDLCVETSVV